MENAVTYLTIDETQAGQKLLAFLGRNLRGQSGAALPAALLHKLVRSGQIRVNRGRVKPGYQLQSGDVLRLPPLQRVCLKAGGQTATAAPAAPAENIPAQGQITAAPLEQTEQGQGFPDRLGHPKTSAALTLGERLRQKLPQAAVIAETDCYLALNKPAGLAVHGGSKQAQSLISLLLECFRDLPASGGFIPTLAHRLDRGTSGVLLIAKSYNFLRQVQNALQTGASRKVYLAWVHGAWPDCGQMELKDYLVKQADAKGREKVRTVPDLQESLNAMPDQENSRQGSLCLSRVQLLRRQQRASLLRIELLTGRTHQLRVQLASRGHPIIGDRKYGGSALPFQTTSALLLHSCLFALPEAGLRFSSRPEWPHPFDCRQADLE